METPKSPAERFAARALADRLEMLSRMTPEQIERRAEVLGR